MEQHIKCSHIGLLQHGHNLLPIHNTGFPQLQQSYTIMVNLLNLTRYI